MQENNQNQRTLLYSDGRKTDSDIEFSELQDSLKYGNRRSFSDYTNVKTIGFGGIGTVLSVHERALDRDIALKILRPDFRDKRKYVERVIREAKATAQIDHPNIVPVHELGVLEDVGVFFTMKKVEGETLEYVLERLDAGDEEYLRKYSLSHLLNIFIAICHGVAYAHSRGDCPSRPETLERYARGLRRSNGHGLGTGQEYRGRRGNF